MTNFIYRLYLKYLIYLREPFGYVKAQNDKNVKQNQKKIRMIRNKSLEMLRIESSWFFMKTFFIGIKDEIKIGRGNTKQRKLI